MLRVVLVCSKDEMQEVYTNLEMRSMVVIIHRARQCKNRRVRFERYSESGFHVVMIGAHEITQHLDSEGMSVTCCAKGNSGS